MQMNQHNFTRGAALNASTLARYLTPMSDDEMRTRAPSVFADRPHESRSDRYAYIPTVSIVAGMRKAGFIPVSVQQSRSRVAGKADFTKHMIKFAHGDVTNTRVGDSIPQVCLVNSHDGTSQWELSLGLYRFICSNGLLVCDGNLSSVKVPHKGDVQDRVIEGSFTVLNAARDVGDRAEAWRGITLERGEQVALANAALALRFDRQDDNGNAVAAPIAADQMLRPHRYEDKGADLWTTFNVIQENTIKGGQSYTLPRAAGARRGRRMHVREVTGIDQNTSLNRALWTLADTLKKYKTGEATTLAA
jgi:hypothetical protein